jgi:cysteine-rich repeat protein
VTRAAIVLAAAVLVPAVADAQDITYTRGCTPGLVCSQSVDPPFQLSRPVVCRQPSGPACCNAQPFCLPETCAVADGFHDSSSSILFYEPDSHHCCTGRQRPCDDPFELANEIAASGGTIPADAACLEYSAGSLVQSADISGPGCTFFCGDGFLNVRGNDLAPGTPDDEICDDGNTDDGDGCSSDCTVEVALRPVGFIAGSSGPSIVDFQVAMWIDEFFEDGSKGNGSVDSNMILLFTQCFGGAWLDNFNGTIGDFSAGGLAFDGVAFTNTTRISADLTGLTSDYGGAHVGFRETLEPGANISDVYAAGVAAAQSLEPEDRDPDAPQIFGPTSKTVGGMTSTHILVWASEPDDAGQDLADIAEIRSRFALAPATEITVLAGDQDFVNAHPTVDGPATRDGLRTALMNIGAKMDDGVDEQFVLFLTDHGGFFQSDFVANALAANGGLAAWNAAVTGDTSGAIQKSLADPSVSPPLGSLTFTTSQTPVVDFDPADVCVELQVGANPPSPMGCLDLAVQGTLTLADGNVVNTLELSQSLSEVTDMFTNQIGPGEPASITITATNAGAGSVAIDQLFYSPGNIPKRSDTSHVPAVPAIGAAALLAALLGVGVTAGRRRGRRCQAGRPGA